MIPAGVAQRISAIRGWRRLIVAFVAGALATAALPPFYVVPALWVAFPLLLWGLDGCTSWRAAVAVGWAFGFGHFLTGLSWLINPFYVDADTFAVFAVPAVAALCAGMGFFISIVCVLTQLVPPPTESLMPNERAHRMAARALAFAAAWMLVEWMRGWFLTGFPWNLIATVWTASPIGLAMMQVTSMVGSLGLSLITVAAAALASVLGHAPRWRAAWVWATEPLVLLVMVGAGGAARLASHPTTFVPHVLLRLVQPNIPEAAKWRTGAPQAHLDDYVALSTANPPPGLTAVIWGESAIESFLNLESEFRAEAARAVPTGGVLITGADRAIDANTIFNSLYVLDDRGNVIATYDKSHLVPFGEFMPLRSLIPFQKLTAGGDFSAGSGLKTLSVPGLPPFSPLICFEIIFSGHVTASTRPPPQWLLNLTNDSWFGTATGPYQHFATARLRTVEEGLPLVRVADSGISAVVDAVGRVIASIPLNERGVIDTRLPGPNVSFTFFALLGNFIPLLAATIMSCAAFGVYRCTR